VKQQWTNEELIEHFILLPSEKLETRLGFATLFKYFQYESRFPEDRGNIPFSVIEFLAKQLSVSMDQFYGYTQMIYKKFPNGLRTKS
jgi:hypothetical protein